MQIASVINYIIWDVSPTIFQLGPLKAKYYGLFFSSLCLAGYVLLRFMFRKEGLPATEALRLFIYILIGVIIGLRMGHVLFYEPEYYFNHLWEIPMIWKGGLASHGGTIGIIIAIWIFTRKSTKKSMLWTLDRVSLVGACGASLIRFGNLFNSEIIGKPSDLPWSFVFQRVDNIPRHPAQLYEALFYLAVFILLFFWYIKLDGKVYSGLFFAMLLILIFTFRFFIEFVKETQVGFEDEMALNLGQSLSIPFIIMGVILLVIALKRKQVK